MERIRIEGIKLSGELAAINFRNLPGEKDFISRFCQILAENQVNLLFLSTTSLRKNNQISCCVAATDLDIVKKLIASEPVMASHTEFILPVGSLSIFPHQFSLKILGLILNIFGRINIPLYGLTSSLSALTCITDYAHLHTAVKAIRENIDVPSDQISLKPEIQVKQSQDYKNKLLLRKTNSS